MDYSHLVTRQQFIPCSNTRKSSVCFIVKMYTNEKYIQGDQNVQVPAHLSFGKFMLDSLRRMGDEIAIVSTIDNFT